MHVCTSIWSSVMRHCFKRPVCGTVWYEYRVAGCRRQRLSAARRRLSVSICLSVCLSVCRLDRVMYKLSKLAAAAVTIRCTSLREALAVEPSCVHRPSQAAADRLSQSLLTGKRTVDTDCSGRLSAAEPGPTGGASDMEVTPTGRTCGPPSSYSAAGDLRHRHCPGSCPGP